MKKNGKKFGSDLEFAAKHEITPEEYDELPELTDEMLARGVRKRNGRVIGRPKAESPKPTITLRMDAEVISTLRQHKGYNAIVESLVRREIDAGRL